MDITVIFKVCQTVNPASLMPVPDLETRLSYYCVETIEQIYSNHLDLKDEPYSIQMPNGSQMKVVL